MEKSDIIKLVIETVHAELAAIRKSCKPKLNPNQCELPLEAPQTTLVPEVIEAAEVAREPLPQKYELALVTELNKKVVKHKKPTLDDKYRHFCQKLKGTYTIGSTVNDLKYLKHVPEVYSYKRAIHSEETWQKLLARACEDGYIEQDKTGNLLNYVVLLKAAIQDLPPCVENATVKDCKFFIAEVAAWLKEPGKQSEPLLPFKCTPDPFKCTSITPVEKHRVPRLYIMDALVKLGIFNFGWTPACSPVYYRTGVEYSVELVDLLLNFKEEAIKIYGFELEGMYVAAKRELPSLIELCKASSVADRIQKTAEYFGYSPQEQSGLFASAVSIIKAKNHRYGKKEISKNIPAA